MKRALCAVTIAAAVLFFALPALAQTNAVANRAVDTNMDTNEETATNGDEPSLIAPSPEASAEDEEPNLIVPSTTNTNDAADEADEGMSTATIIIIAAAGLLVVIVIVGLIMRKPKGQQPPAAPSA